MKSVIIRSSLHWPLCESHSVVSNCLWPRPGGIAIKARILQARILEKVAVPVSRGSSQPRIQTQVSCIAGAFFTVWATSGYCCILYISMCVWCYYCLPPVTAEEKLWNSVNIEQEPQKEIETVLKLENVSVNENLLNVLREKWQISHGQRQIQTEDSGIFTASNQTRNKQLQKQWGNITAPT